LGVRRLSRALLFRIALELEISGQHTFSFEPRDHIPSGVKSPARA